MVCVATNITDCINDEWFNWLLPHLYLFIIFFRPDTQSYIEKLKREEQERAKGQTEDKRSFLAKYVSIENIQGQIFIETN